MGHAFKSNMVAVFALWCLAATAAAGPIEDAVAARIKGDPATALRILRPLADKGDAAAQSNLALMYATGQGVPLSLTEAAKWYRLAADQGRANAQYNLGRMHATGQGMPPNLAEALKWWRAAADQGHSAAQYNLGLMYAEGRGVPQNAVEAAKWWRLAAEQGDIPSQFNLGVAYSQGKGVVQNTMEATKWYRQAADRNHTAAQVNLGTAYDQGRGVIQNDTLAYLVVQPAASKGDQMAVKARDAIAKRMTAGTDRRGAARHARMEADPAAIAGAIARRRTGIAGSNAIWGRRPGRPWTTTVHHSRSSRTGCSRPSRGRARSCRKIWSAA